MPEKISGFRIRFSFQSDRKRVLVSRSAEGHSIGDGLLPVFSVGFNDAGSAGDRAVIRDDASGSTERCASIAIRHGNLHFDLPCVADFDVDRFHIDILNAITGGAEGTVKTHGLIHTDLHKAIGDVEAVAGDRDISCLIVPAGGLVDAGGAVEVDVVALNSRVDKALEVSAVGRDPHSLAIQRAGIGRLDIFIQIDLEVPLSIVSGGGDRPRVVGALGSGSNIISSLRSLFQRGYCRKENQGVTQGICTAFCGFGFAVLEKVPSRTAVLMTKR